MLELLVTEKLAEIIGMYYEEDKQAEKIMEIIESLQADEGKYQPSEFRQAVENALAKDVKLNPLVKRRISRYMRFLFPPGLA